MIVQLNHKKMKIGEKIDSKVIGTREFYSMTEFFNTIKRTTKVMCWGAHAWTKMNKYVLRFKVEAHRHKGHIYVCVNGADYFDVYLTTTHGKITHVFNDVFLGDFITLVDDRIERIEDYKF